MIAKMIVWGRTRDEAIRRTRRALQEYRISGVDSTLGFHQVLMENQRFLAGELSTRFLEEEYPEGNFSRLDDGIREKAAIAAALDKFVKERRLTVRSGEQKNRNGSGWAAFHRRANLKSFGGSH
jgi:acetyl/propionyl-CoA carboxylase alpha subunit